MNEIREWSFEGAQVRTLELDGEPWFVGKDIAARLGYKDTAKAIRDHVDEDDKGVSVLDTPGGKQQLTVINESGVYALIFGSKLEAAKRFKRWVTSEVLPAIRKTGSYQKPDSYMIDDRVQRAQRWIEEETERKALRNQLQQQEHKVALADAITASPDCIHIGELAKILRQNGVDTGQTRLFKWMREHEWLCSGNGQRNMPTQRAIERGYMEMREHIIHIEGREVTKFTPMITGPGQAFFVNWFLNTHGGRKPREIAAERLATK